MKQGEDVLKRGDGGSGNWLGPCIEWEIAGPGLIAPFFVCAACGERITRGDANALLEFDGAWRHTGRWVVVHRGDRCDPPGGPSGPFRLWGWEELSGQLVMLLLNSGYDLEALAARQDRLRALRAEVLADPDREPKSVFEMADYLDAGLWTIG